MTDKGKNFKGAASSFHGNTKGMPFQPEDYEDDELWDALEPETITSGEIPIIKIYADPLQPRRIIPHEIRGEWDGDPAKMLDILQAWAALLYDSGNDIPIVKILKRQQESSQYLTGEKFVDSFISLLGIAASIRAIGLNQAIGLRPISGDNYRIIFGERRWTAFHLLNHFLTDENFNTIPTKIADVSEWQIRSMQVSENNSREDTNAIGKAREFALLLITARNEINDYDPPHTLNTPDCDRPWYAQVANGEVHRIPRGMGPEFEQALGISTKQMRNYRNLLKLTEDHQVNNTIWDTADDNDWAEGFMRDISSYLEIGTVREILYRTNWDGIELEEALREAIQSAKNGASLAKKQQQREDQPYLNRWLELADGWIGRVTQQNGTRITLEDTDGKINIANTALIIDTNVTPRSNQKESPSPSESEANTMGRDLGRDSDLPPSEQRESPHYRLPSEIEPDNTQGSDNSSSQLPAPGSQDAALLAKVLDWISKPARYDDEPCFVLAKTDTPGMVFIQTNTARFEVHIDELSPPAQPQSTTVTDFMSGKSDETDTLPQGIGNGLFSNQDRTHLGDLIRLIAVEGVDFDALVRLHKATANNTEVDDLPQMLEQGYQQIEAYTAHIEKKYKALFKDIADQYLEATDD